MAFERDADGCLRTAVATPHLAGPYAFPAQRRDEAAFVGTTGGRIWRTCDGDFGEQQVCGGHAVCTDCIEPDFSLACRSLSSFSFVNVWACDAMRGGSGWMDGGFMRFACYG